MSCRKMWIGLKWASSCNCGFPSRIVKALWPVIRNIPTVVSAKVVMLLRAVVI